MREPVDAILGIAIGKAKRSKYEGFTFGDCVGYAFPEIGEVVFHRGGQLPVSDFAWWTGSTQRNQRR
ncbi:unannotated protein [freshwater metagenome]|uniref:Unannotated protein n=1 Tax=freshwater metagenome TaxID=449393 RepID=A0A6J7DUU0_9ZZZZ